MFLALGFAGATVAAGCGSRTGAFEDAGDLGGSGGGSAAGSSSGGSSSGGPSGSSSGTLTTPCRTGLPAADSVVFEREADYLAYFREEAVENDPALCGLGTTLSTCAYDPRTPRTSPADVHHSGPLNEFVGPDGDAYDWVYLADAEEWIVGDLNYAPNTYSLILAYLTCVANEGQ